MDEEENLIKKKSYEVGENLDNFSIDDLDIYLLKLDEEISRVKSIKKSKIAALTKAKSFLKDDKF